MKIQLQRIRKAAGKNQQEMADLLGVKKRTYGSWERGEAMMNLEQAYKCAVLLGCTIDEIAGLEPPMRIYSDPEQERLNLSYENMNAEGRKALVKVARGMEKDTDNRIFKEGPEYIGSTAAAG